ncbi:2-oxoacid:ferredoxin oxidoreductase subunit alpha [Prosthecochloris sp. GSB1]|uniref:2-oxoacid:acceptor oxidoreductase subunit alpha n=1 Tax=Prosthecochloris sp. GSB1 TaxID=281093 RepID=UPI000B8C71C9|nr:2-oxoacid:acceptor oxidoreductase subunit alpha [Prosthecochloris sp. GSB1]ASQ90226.1 2-oxoacid:ferredoxin oxidoreductase subunit alpha [Prosthecochloris sp. GSB1]
MRNYVNDVSLVFGGAAGQGVQTIADAVVTVLKQGGYHVFACTEFMSRIRGGSNSTEVRVTSKKRSAYVRRIDFLFALNAEVAGHLRERIDGKTLVFAEKEEADEEEDFPGRRIETPFSRFAEEAGKPIYSNTVAVGVVLGIMDVALDGFLDYLGKLFSPKGEDVVESNRKAAMLGYRFGKEIAEKEGIRVEIDRDPSGGGSLLVDGNTAMGIGSVAAGCSFVSSYPMSPGTGLLTFLAGKSGEFDLIVDQAEDEIAAINAALGASYAGARALVTTSGGGFALMEEGVSLAGATETPVVVHIGQRPGPATGLPTRMEQSDLDLVLHAGHGDFSRVVFAPGSFAQAIEIMQRAFDLAERFQTTVFVLTDQYFLDSVETIEEATIVRLPVERHIVKTGEKYRRYVFTGDGVSPRGVPGFGDGIVKVDSHEHDESGHLTENFHIRKLMVEKRLRRLDELAGESLMPEFLGADKSAGTLVISWGSNRGVLEEALELSGRDDVAGLHFSQLYPLKSDVRKLLDGKTLHVLENNATGQFADLLRREFGCTVSGRILKATGEPFSLEEVVEALKEV